MQESSRVGAGAGEVYTPTWRLFKPYGKRLATILNAKEKLIEADIPFRFVSNTTKESRETLLNRLRRLGFKAKDEDVFTSLTAVKQEILRRGLRPMLFLERDALQDFKGIAVDNPNAVVVGLSPSNFHYDKMNDAFRLLLSGSPLIAIHKGRYYKRGDGLALGPGPIVSALEYAASCEAEVIGKPNKSFFTNAVKDMNLSLESSLFMIGDDVHDDIAGAQAAGIKGILVKTGLPRGRRIGRYHASNKKQSIAKRVEIPGTSDEDHLFEKPFRRQSVIHAGVDYGSKDIVDETATDEFENLGKMTDFSGKVLKSGKSKPAENKPKYKDVQPTTKDIIERMKELQDNLFRRGGSKELAAKLKLMEPEIASAAKSGKDGEAHTTSPGLKVESPKISTSTSPKVDLSQFPLPVVPFFTSSILPNTSTPKHVAPLTAPAPQTASAPQTSLATQTASAPQTVSAPLTASAPQIASAPQTASAPPTVSTVKAPQEHVPEIVPPPQVSSVQVVQNVQQPAIQAAQHAPPLQTFTQPAPQTSPLQVAQQPAAQSLPSVTKQLLTQNVLSAQVASPAPPIALPKVSPLQLASQLPSIVAPPTNNNNKAPSETEKAESRKIIPEDVVNKIIEKFQELKTEAKNFAILEKSNSSPASSPKSEPLPVEIKEAPKAEKPETSSPYASIGPAKDNEELKNLTNNSNPLNSGILQDSQLVQSPNIGPVVPAAPPPSQPLTMTPLMKPQNQMPVTETQGAQTTTPSTQGNIPMMFIKTGQVLVPIFGNQGADSSKQQIAAAPTQTSSQPSSLQAPLPSLPMSALTQQAVPSTIPLPQPEQSPVLPVPQQENQPIFSPGAPEPQQTVPQSPSAFSQYQPVPVPMPASNFPEAAQSMPPPMSFMSPQVMNQDPGSRCCVPGQNFPSMPETSSSQSPQPPQLPSVFNQMQLLPPSMNQPGPPGIVNTAMLNNIPALPSVPNQMMGGVVNALSQPVFMSPQTMFSQRNMPLTGTARGMSNGPYNQPRTDAMKPSSPSESAFLGPSAIGSSLMRSSGMNIPDSSSPTVNPWQDAHPEAANNLAVMQKEKELEQAALNDISDPVQNAPQIGNVSPDQLLDIADARSNLESINPDAPPRRSPNKVNPDSLLDRIQGEELRGGLAGAGDPSKDISHMKGMGPPEPPSPFTGTTPDDLLDLLSNKNKGSFSDHNRNLFSMSSNFLRPHDHPRMAFANFPRVDDPSPRHQFVNSDRNEYDLQTLGTSGMQSVGAMPSASKHNTGFDPSVADIVEPKSSERNPSDLLSQYVAQHHTEKIDNSLVNPLSKSVSVMSDDVLQFEHSRKAIDSDDIISKYNQEQAQTRHNIQRPQYEHNNSKRAQRFAKPVRKTTIATNTLSRDNIELRVNGQKLLDDRSMRSKIINGSVVIPKGKTLSTKGPIRVELSHSNDMDHTKIVNIVTSSKFNITDSRRNHIRKP